MKTRHYKSISALLSGLILCLFFQNGSHVNWDEITLERVDLSSRNTHARELLGSSYKKSAARWHEGNIDLSKAMLERVRRSLPKDFRDQSGAVTKAILMESKKHRFDPVFVLAIIETESSFNPLTIGGVGEIGLMQIRPETAEWIARKKGLAWKGAESLKNPVINVRIGVAYMAWLREEMGTNSVKYVSAYNMGPLAVKRLLAAKKKPKEYRSRVLANYEELYRGMAPARLASAKL